MTTAMFLAAGASPLAVLGVGDSRMASALIDPSARIPVRVEALLQALRPGSTGGNIGAIGTFGTNPPYFPDPNPGWDTAIVLTGYNAATGAAEQVGGPGGPHWTASQIYAGVQLGTGVLAGGGGCSALVDLLGIKRIVVCDDWMTSEPAIVEYNAMLLSLGMPVAGADVRIARVSTRVDYTNPLHCPDGIHESALGANIAAICIVEQLLAFP